MMLSNWAQQTFVEPTNLRDNYINCINTKYNQMCWNDDYHFVHDNRPAWHYTEISSDVLKNKDFYIKKKN